MKKLALQLHPLPHLLLLLAVKDQVYKALWPLFGWLPTDFIKCTFEVTTHYPVCMHQCECIFKETLQISQPCLECALVQLVYGGYWLILCIWIHLPLIVVFTVAQFVGCDSMIIDACFQPLLALLSVLLMLISGLLLHLILLHKQYFCFVLFMAFLSDISRVLSSFVPTNGKAIILEVFCIAPNL